MTKLTTDDMIEQLRGLIEGWEDALERDPPDGATTDLGKFIPSKTWGYWYGLYRRNMHVRYPAPPTRKGVAYSLFWLDTASKDGGPSALVWEPDDLDVYLRQVNGNLRLDLQGRRHELGRVWPRSLQLTRDKLIITSYEFPDGYEIMEWPHSIDNLAKKGWWVNQPETNLDGKLPHLTFPGECEFRAG